MNETIAYLPGLSPVAGKDVRARFDGGRLSSDGGVLLLREIEGGLAIAERLSSCVKDDNRTQSVSMTAFRSPADPHHLNRHALPKEAHKPDPGAELEFSGNWVLREGGR